MIHTPWRTPAQLQKTLSAKKSKHVLSSPYSQAGSNIRWLARETSPILPQYYTQDNANYSQPRSTEAATAVSREPDDFTIPPAGLPEFEMFGWQEHALPDGSAYFYHSSLRVTVDIDLSDADIWEAFKVAFDEKLANLAVPIESWELWLRGAGSDLREGVWVSHSEKVAFPELYTSRPQDYVVHGKNSASIFSFFYATRSCCALRVGARIPVLVIHPDAPSSCSPALEISIQSHGYLEMVLYWYLF